MNTRQADHPAVSLIVPVYHSQATLAASLRSFLALDYPEVQVIVVDSSNDQRCRDIVRNDFPQVVYHQSPERLLPHAARNFGATLARNPWLLFSDPDIYAPSDWLRLLMASRNRHEGAIVSGLACHGGKWFDRGVHFAKFDMLLPQPEDRPAILGATAGLLCSRTVFEMAGGFRGDTMLGDLLFGWQLQAAEVPLTQAAASAAGHHHLTTWRCLCRERWERGQEYVRLLEEQRPKPRAIRLLRLLLTVLPLRWLNFTLRTLARARASGLTGQAICTLPVFGFGHAAWLAGEARQMWRSIFL